MQTGSKGDELVAGRYRLGERLGSGGMGTVWRARDELLERAVALKEIGIPSGLPEAEVERLRKRYLREARAAARLRHEHVVVVHDVISEATRVWIVMELVESPDLATVMSTDGPLTPVAAAKLGLHVLAALKAAHAAGVLHRDVKPANVLITGGGRAVLTDFGVASVVGDASLTATGQLIGSPAYLAPERLTGGGAGPHSDLWALGCTLYAAVEGTSPFWRAEPFEIVSAITVEALRRPKAAGPLTPVIYGLLEKEPAERWDAERTRAALERVVAGLDVEIVPSWGAVASPPPAPSSSAAGGAAEEGSAATPPTPPPAAEDGDTDAAASGAPTGDRRRRRSWFKFLTVALVVGGLATVGALVALRPFPLPYLDEAAEADGNAHPSNAEPPPPVEYRDPAGYRLLVPAGWDRSSVTPGASTFRKVLGPDTGNTDLYLRVRAKPARGKSSLQITRAVDKQHAGKRAGLAAYRQFMLRPATLGQYKGTIHRYAYRATEGPRLAAVFRTVWKNVSYEVSLDTPADMFDTSATVFDGAVASLAISAIPS